MQEDTQIEALIAKFFSGEASPEEAMQLEDWAEISPENRSYLNTSANFFTMNLALNTIENKQQVWGNIQNTIVEPVLQQKQIKWQWIAIAASAMLILSFILLHDTFRSQKNSETTYQTDETPKKVTLKDNTAISISPNSSITIDDNYGIASRRVKLKGSAQFSVKHDAARPFVVAVNDIHIKDLGTAFIVKTVPSGNFIFIGVTEGEVEVSDSFGYSKILKAGDKATYSLTHKCLYPVNFEPTKEPLVPEIKENKTVIQTPDTTRKKKGSVQVSTSTSVSSSSDKNGYSHSYSSSYSLDKSYTREGQQELIDRANKTTKRILADMLNDGLIENDKNVSFKLSNKGFFINDEKQSEAVFQRYEKKYNPEINTNGEWSWTYNSND